jgi:hypothetical protein
MLASFAATPVTDHPVLQPFRVHVSGIMQKYAKGACNKGKCSFFSG